MSVFSECALFICVPWSQGVNSRVRATRTWVAFSFEYIARNDRVGCVPGTSLCCVLNGPSEHDNTYSSVHGWQGNPCGTLSLPWITRSIRLATNESSLQFNKVISPRILIILKSFPLPIPQIFASISG